LAIKIPLGAAENDVGVKFPSNELPPAIGACTSAVIVGVGRGAAVEGVGSAKRQATIKVAKIAVLRNRKFLSLTMQISFQRQLVLTSWTFGSAVRDAERDGAGCRAGSEFPELD
jgi:hypothetical protein